MGCCKAQCARPTRLPGPGETPRQRLVRPSARMGHLAALVHHGPTGKKPQCFERGMETQAPHLDACQCSPRAFNGADFPFLGYVTRGTECSLRQSERALPAGTLVGALKTLASRCTAHRCPATGARTGEHLYSAGPASPALVAPQGKLVRQPHSAASLSAVWMTRHGAAGHTCNSEITARGWTGLPRAPTSAGAHVCARGFSQAEAHTSRRACRQPAAGRAPITPAVSPLTRWGPAPLSEGSPLLSTPWLIDNGL
jgi:hypothetical protein